jgi:hypothetical protein
LAGDRQKAAAFYANLLANCQRAEPNLPQLNEARLFLGRK